MSATASWPRCAALINTAIVEPKVCKNCTYMVDISYKIRHIWIIICVQISQGSIGSIIYMSICMTLQLLWCNSQWGKKTSWHFATIGRNSWEQPPAGIMCHIIPTTIVLVKMGWDNFVGCWARLSRRLFSNSDRDRIERRWALTIPPFLFRNKNLCE